MEVRIYAVNSLAACLPRGFSSPFRWGIRWTAAYLPLGRRPEILPWISASLVSNRRSSQHSQPRPSTKVTSVGEASSWLGATALEPFLGGTDELLSLGRRRTAVKIFSTSNMTYIDRWGSGKHPPASDMRHVWRPASHLLTVFHGGSLTSLDQYIQPW